MVEVEKPGPAALTSSEKRREEALPSGFGQAAALALHCLRLDRWPDALSFQQRRDAGSRWVGHEQIWVRCIVRERAVEMAARDSNRSTPPLPLSEPEAQSPSRPSLLPHGMPPPWPHHEHVAFLQHGLH